MEHESNAIDDEEENRKMIEVAFIYTLPLFQLT